jgi:nitrate/nitrite-specific signal transduction histidine kinase
VLYLQVSDDGIGAPDEALNDARSYGVLGMRERAAQFGGRLGIAGAPGRGTTVRLVMPLDSGPRQDGSPVAAPPDDAPREGTPS